ncbi:MAG: CotH kinase family protein [Planctomycetaceae bacterium]
MIETRSLITLLTVGLALPGFAADPTAPPAGVPVVTIATAGGAGVASRDESVNCRVAIDPCGLPDAAGRPLVGLTATSAKIRGRGNTTWSYPKKPYRVKFDAPLDVLGMGAARTWVLLADYIDPSGLRNATAFELGRRLGMPFTPQCRHVWLVLDGVPRGLFLLTEQTEVAPQRVVTDPTAGFLVEFDDYDGEEIYSTPVLDLPLKIKRPDVAAMPPEARAAEVARIMGLFTRLEETIAAEDGPGDYAALVDADSLVDWFLVHEIAHNVEPQHPKSCFFHRGPDGRIVAGPLWDFDWAYDYEGDATDVLALRDAFWFRHLFKDPAFRAKVKARWRANKAPHVDTLPAFIDTLATRIRPAVEADAKLWPTDDDIRTPAAAATLHAWLVERIAALDAAIAALE